MGATGVIPSRKMTVYQRLNSNPPTRYDAPRPFRRASMRELVHRYLGQELSRRGFVKSLSGLGFTAAAAQAILAPLEASERAAVRTDFPGASTIEGTGGDLVVAQAKAAGAEYLFTNPGSFEVGFFDAFTDVPGMQLIMGLHEGIVISMADGYHRVSGKPAF